MFTGIVEELGEVVRLAPYAGGVRFTVRASFAKEGEVGIGDSVAINGCCLTVVEIVDGCLGFDLLAETRRVTNLASLAVGSVVNLERSLRFDGRIGGHFVSGHVDAAAPVAVIEPRGSDVHCRVVVPEAFRRYLVSKGSVAVDGISLTVAELTVDGFAVWLIPHTLAITTLGVRKAGDLVNLEFDLLAKYVERIVTGARES
ncbi:MAG TPA: riboflavin synthase [Opitutaceae bacterium]